jgi:hypothetical protein
MEHEENFLRSKLFSLSLNLKGEEEKRGEMVKERVFCFLQPPQIGTETEIMCEIFL